MAISKDLAKTIESDVKGSKQEDVEKQVKDALAELKNKLNIKQEYQLSTLYELNFQKYLRSKRFDTIEPKEIIAINNIKQRLIKQGLENEKAEKQSPNFVTKCIYRISGISQDITKNSKIENVIKGVIDELMAIPDMVIQIAKDPIAFAKALYNLIKNPGDLWKGLKQAYGDAFTQGLATPEAQYRTGRSATLIAITLLPGGATKFGLNVAGLRTVTRQVSKAVTKAKVKNIARTTSKSAAKSVESGVKSATKTAERGLKNHNGSKMMYREMNGGAKNYAQRQVEKNAVQISKETQAATKAGRVANIAKKTPGILRRGVDKVIRFGDKLPVIKQINSITRWTFKKLDAGTEAVVKKIHPKFYEKLMKQEASLKRIKTSAESAAKNLNAQTAKVEAAAKKVIDQKKKIKTIEDAIAKKTGKKYNIGHLNRAKATLGKLEGELKNLRRVETNLRRKLKNANEKYLVHQNIIEGMNNAQRMGKLALWIEAQQVASILNHAEIANLDREIDEAISEIDETGEEFINDVDREIDEINNLLKEFEGEFSGLESGQTEFLDESISIDIPEGVKLSEIDVNTYKIVITGLASKTGTDAINRKIAQQRAENAKKIIMEKYGIKDAGQIEIQIDLQANHPDKLGEDVSKWQGAKIKLEPITKTTNKPSSTVIDEEDPDASLEEAIKEV